MIGTDLRPRTSAMLSAFSGRCSITNTGLQRSIVAAIPRAVLGAQPFRVDLHEIRGERQVVDRSDSKRRFASATGASTRGDKRHIKPERLLGKCRRISSASCRRQPVFSKPNSNRKSALMLPWNSIPVWMMLARKMEALPAGCPTSRQQCENCTGRTKSDVPALRAST